MTPLLIGIVVALAALAFVVAPMIRRPSAGERQGPPDWDDEAERMVLEARAHGHSCSACGPRPEPDACFCSTCGLALGVCGRCGHPVATQGASFCEECGAPLGPRA